MKIWDISPPITSNIAVFPGDRPFSRHISLNFAQGDHILLSSIETTLHLGAHADAPNHYHPRGEGIGDRSLHFYLGPCQVMRINSQGHSRLYPKDLSSYEIKAKRILVDTGSFPDPNQWHDPFTALSPELIDYFADRGVVLVGIDTPSVDPADSKDLETHQSVFRRNLAILEGLVLSHVPEGIYTLVALPLKIRDGDASPVRAVLLSPILPEVFVVEE